MRVCRKLERRVRPEDDLAILLRKDPTLAGVKLGNKNEWSSV